MKECPVCKCIVEDIYECPICKATLTYEPVISDEKQRCVLNKYYLRYLLMNAWFPILCLVVCCTNILRSHNFQISELLCGMIIFCVTSLITIERQKMLKRLQRVYSKERSVGMILIMRYLCGFLAVICSFVLSGLNL